MSVAQFGKAPRPNEEIIRALEDLLSAVKSGHVVGVCLIAMNPLREVEHAYVGRLDNQHRLMLIGALSTVAQELIQKSI